MGLHRLYETTFIVNAALEDQDIESVISKVSTYIENHGGIIQETHRWGRRRLAYPISKKYNGFYVHIVFEANPSAIPILERFLVLEDTVLRHLTLLLPKKLLVFRQQKAIRDGRAYSGVSVDTSTTTTPAPAEKKPIILVDLDDEIDVEEDVDLNIEPILSVD